MLAAIDGRRSCAEIATIVGQTMRRGVSEDMVATLVDQHLRPMGLLKLADGRESLAKSNPLLALKFKLAVTNPRTTRLLTDPFRFLFRPVLASAVVLGFWQSPGGSSSSRASLLRPTTPSSGRTFCCSCS